jgi:hypothetical protein
VVAGFYPQDIANLMGLSARENNLFTTQVLFGNKKTMHYLKALIFNPLILLTTSNNILFIMLPCDD